MFFLAKRYICSNLSTTLLQVLTFSTGTAILLIILSVSTQLTGSFSQGKNKIDAIIGAKGSPLQLVLSGIYHADIPTGNIDYHDAIRLSRHKAVKTAMPISLGDNYRGYRIVGTKENFLKFYNLQITKGTVWTEPMQAVIGHNMAKALNLTVGDNFVGNHGLVEGGTKHDQSSYKVVGILEKSGTITDRLAFTSLASIWDIHDHHNDKEHDEHEEHANHEQEEDKEITALLIKYKNRMAALSFPRMVNKQTNMQAASPSFEVAKLFKMLGIGFDTAKIIGYILLSISILSIFLILLSNIRKRHYDMAILRVFGARPYQIMQLVMFEGMILATVGLILGFIISRAILLIIGNIIENSAGLSIGITSPTQQELAITAIILGVSLLASIIPAIMAYRVNIINLLSKNT